MSENLTKSDALKWSAIVGREASSKISSEMERRTERWRDEQRRLPEMERQTEASASSSQVVDWVRQPLQRLRPSMLQYVRTDICEDIKSVLLKVGGEDAVQLFRSGVFGYFLDFVGGGCSRQALSALMAREVVASDPRLEGRERQFHISGSTLHFGPREYALVSGLRFGGSSFNPNTYHDIPERGIFHRLFKGKRTTIGDMLAKFQNQGLADHPQDYVKVANILFVYLMLFCIDTSRAIESWVWALVEDVESWNSFPWGAYSFKMFMHFMSLVPKTREAMGGRGQGAYHFYGPIWILQVWACEVIPEFARQCGDGRGHHMMPRCLKWAFTCVPSFDFLSFFDGRFVVVSMIPSPEEVLTSYYQTVTHEREILGVTYIVRRKISRKKILANLASRVIEIPMTCDATVAADVGPSRSQRPRQSKRTRKSETRNSTEHEILERPQSSRECEILDRPQSSREHEIPEPMSKDWFEKLANRVADIVVPRVREIIEESITRHRRCIVDDVVAQLDSRRRRRSPTPSHDSGRVPSRQSNRESSHHIHKSRHSDTHLTHHSSHNNDRH